MVEIELIMFCGGQAMAMDLKLLILLIPVILVITICIFSYRNKNKTYTELYLENCTSGIIAIDKNEVIVIYNQAAADLIGIAKEEMLGKTYNELIKKNLGSADGILLNTLRTGKVYQHVERVIDTASGPLHVMAYTDLMKDSRGRIMGSLLNIRDVSDQKQLEAQIMQSEKFDLIGEIAAGIANEVRNPLTTLRGHLQLLERKLPREDAKNDYIRIMLDEIYRLNFFISEFLLLSRPIVPIRQETAIHSILDEVLTAVEKDYQTISLVKEYHNGLPDVLADVEQIKHVFLNLTTNAVAAMPDGGELKIITDFNYLTGFISITFADNGIGMEQLLVERIFEPFFTTKVNVAGLGLTVSKRIIYNHGGKIKAESQPGIGTTIRIQLPVTEEKKP